MKKKLVNYLIICSIFLSMILLIIITTTTTNNNYEIFNKDEEEIFFNKFRNGKNLNDGITIQGPQQFSLSKDGANDHKGFTFYVNNNTNKSVSFSNQGFGMKILFFNMQNQQWKEIVIQKPAEIPRIIPSQFESNNNYYKYWWSVVDPKS